ncbi:hypothetical protein A2W14_05220 [Candidatus Gottesmanbacteria bacterium RBG_16_37_8]|uniref:Methionine--tRNA ligase n=1 Tax=Candidatus Gottesmanbacteria bacterium RBG_16_37_8 TaxID=1798371 RepID=A0A1F5YSY0_9BACT|nr:MAG: hypothetical protein A2W14_05220 [Candidatus Gottesmanbacteria bacterium RBG_16_37_8]
MKADISFEEFQKLDLRVGEVVSAERVTGSNNLIRLKVNLGNGFSNRNILSGIARWYKPEELTGKKFIFVVNLRPKKIIGEESQGMILCADSNHTAIAVEINDKIPEGTIIR